MGNQTSCDTLVQAQVDKCGKCNVQIASNNTGRLACHVCTKKYCSSCLRNMSIMSCDTCSTFIGKCPTAGICQGKHGIAIHNALKSLYTSQTITVVEHVDDTKINTYTHVLVTKTIRLCVLCFKHAYPSPPRTCGHYLPRGRKCARTCSVCKRDSCPVCLNSKTHGVGCVNCESERYLVCTSCRRDVGVGGGGGGVGSLTLGALTLTRGKRSTSVDSKVMIQHTTTSQRSPESLNDDIEITCSKCISQLCADCKLKFLPSELLACDTCKRSCCESCTWKSRCNSCWVATDPKTNCRCLTCDRWTADTVVYYPNTQTIHYDNTISCDVCNSKQHIRLHKLLQNGDTYPFIPLCCLHSPSALSWISQNYSCHSCHTIQKDIKLVNCAWCLSHPVCTACAWSAPQQESSMRLFTSIDSNVSTPTSTSLSILNVSKNAAFYVYGDVRVCQGCRIEFIQTLLKVMALGPSLIVEYYTS